MKRVWIALAVTGAVAGCTSSEPAATGNGQAATGEVDRGDVARAVAAVRIEPGQWEQTSRVLSAEAPNLPREIAKAMQDQVNTSRYCITPEQANDQAEIARRIGQERDGCTLQNFSMANGQMRGQMVCNPGTEQEVRADTSGDYSPTGYTYRSTIEMPAPMMGGEVRMSVEVSGRRIAATCSEGDSQP